jgi:hypothetical protein
VVGVWSHQGDAVGEQHARAERPREGPGRVHAGQVVVDEGAHGVDGAAGQHPHPRANLMQRVALHDEGAVVVGGDGGGVDEAHHVGVQGLKVVKGVARIVAACAAEGALAVAEHHGEALRDEGVGGRHTGRSAADDQYIHLMHVGRLYGRRRVGERAEPGHLAGHRLHRAVDRLAEAHHQPVVIEVFGEKPVGHPKHIEARVGEGVLRRGDHTRPRGRAAGHRVGVAVDAQQASLAVAAQAHRAAGAVILRAARERLAPRRQEAQRERLALQGGHAVAVVHYGDGALRAAGGEATREGALRRQLCGVETARGHRRAQSCDRARSRCIIIIVVRLRML